MSASRAAACSPAVAASLAIAVLGALAALSVAGGSRALAQAVSAPQAVDLTITVGSTTPPEPVTITLYGSDQQSPDTPAFAILALPAHGTVTVPPSAAQCVMLMEPQPLAEATRPTIWPPPDHASCTATVQYTPAAGATGLDAFAYTFTNGARTSEVATVTVRLPGAGAEGTFDRPLDQRGINPAVWNGGTLAQLSAATSAAGGTTVTMFVGGKPVVLIPDAPPFVAAPAEQAYPTGYVLAGTIVLVAR